MCSLRGSFDFGLSRHLGENPRGTWKLRIRHMPTLPDCTSLAAFTRSLASKWYDSYCVDSFREILSSWSVVVTGHTGVPTEPVTLSVAAASVAEGGRRGCDGVGGRPPRVQDLVVPLAFAGVSAEADADYSAPASMTVEAGSLSATATISIAQNSVYEGPETFAVGLRGLPLVAQLAGCVDDPGGLDGEFGVSGFHGITEQRVRALGIGGEDVRGIRVR